MEIILCSIYYWASYQEKQGSNDHKSWEAGCFWGAEGSGIDRDTWGRDGGAPAVFEGLFYFLTKEVIILVFALWLFIMLYICFEHFNLRVFYFTI